MFSWLADHRFLSEEGSCTAGLMDSSLSGSDGCSWKSNPGKKGPFFCKNCLFNRQIRPGSRKTISWMFYPQRWAFISKAPCFLHLQKKTTCHHVFYKYRQQCGSTLNACPIPCQIYFWERHAHKVMCVASFWCRWVAKQRENVNKSLCFVRAGRAGDVSGSTMDQFSI